MNEALEKIKAGIYYTHIYVLSLLLVAKMLVRFFYLYAELMLLGFISLLLTIGQGPISRICVPAKVATIMLPCSRNYKERESVGKTNRRKLLWHEREGALRRVLAGASTSDSCSNYGVRAY